MAPTFVNLTVASALLVSAGTVAYAGGTEAQREACTPDAFRLCTSAMPDEGRVESCLRAAGPRLSAACYNVFYPQSANNQPGVTRGQAAAHVRMQPATDRTQTPSMPQQPPASDTAD